MKSGSEPFGHETNHGNGDERFCGAEELNCNVGMRAKQLREFCIIDAATEELLKTAINQFNLSGRGYDRILRVARTIADLEGADAVELHHVAEAINYRSFDRKLFG